MSFGLAIQSVFCNLATRLAGYGGEPVGGYLNRNSSHRHSHDHIMSGKSRVQLCFPSAYVASNRDHITVMVKQT